MSGRKSGVAADSTMRIVASIMLPLAFLKMAKVFHEMKYWYGEHPGWSFWFYSLVWLVLSLSILVFLACKLKDRVIVPAIVATAIAAWSLTFTSPEHRDWAEWWFGLALVSIPISVSTSMTLIWLDHRFKKGGVESSNKQPPTEV